MNRPSHLSLVSGRYVHVINSCTPHTHMTYSLCYEDDGGAHKMATTGLRQKAIQETLQSVLNNNTLSSNDHLLTNE